MTYEDWLAEIANLLGTDPDQVADLHGIEELYRAGASPSEAADWWRTR